MISKTSWFNKGVYLCALKRFLWGAVLYFVLLFLCTVMPILGTAPTALIYEEIHTHGIILRMDFLAVPLLLSFCVPTVVAVLSFRFVHAKRMSVFTHSLPVSRTDHFMATLAAGFTLMLIPVLLNGLMLMLVSCNGYAVAFSIADCGIWMLANSWSLFLMFAVAVLSVQLTGNSFAAVGINLLLHIFAPLLIVCVSGLAETFVHGFVGYDWLDVVLQQEFLVHIWETMSWFWDGLYPNTTYAVLFYLNLALAAVCYGVAFVLYKKRHMETAEDVAAFSWVRPILKYCITFLGVLTVCAISVGLYANTAWIMLPVFLLTSFVLYFGTEMLLKKSFRVWNAYKGYVIFAVVMIGMAVGLPLSHYFGYETYVPQTDAVQSVTVEQIGGFSCTPSLHRGENITDKAVIETVRAWHDKFTHTENSEFGGHMHLQYKLKNGKTVSRMYIISETDCAAMYADVTAHTAYREAVFDYQWPSLERVTAIYVNHNDSSEGILNKAQIAELYGCIRQDHMQFMFPPDTESEILEADNAEKTENSEDSFEIIIGYTEKNTTDEYMQGFSLNAQYTQTCAWLKAHRYAHPGV